MNWLKNLSHVTLWHCFKWSSATWIKRYTQRERETSVLTTTHTRQLSTWTAFEEPIDCCCRDEERFWWQVDPVQGYITGTSNSNDLGSKTAKMKTLYLIYTHAMSDFHELHDSRSLLVTLINFKCHWCDSNDDWIPVSHKNRKTIKCNRWERERERAREEALRHRSFGCILLFNQRVTAWEKWHRQVHGKQMAFLRRGSAFTGEYKEWRIFKSLHPHPGHLGVKWITHTCWLLHFSSSTHWSLLYHFWKFILHLRERCPRCVQWWI